MRLQVFTFAISLCLIFSFFPTINCQSSIHSSAESIEYIGTQYITGTQGEFQLSNLIINRYYSILMGSNLYYSEFFNFTAIAQFETIKFVYSFRALDLNQSDADTIEFTLYYNTTLLDIASVQVFNRDQLIPIDALYNIIAEGDLYFVAILVFIVFTLIMVFRKSKK